MKKFLVAWAANGISLWAVDALMKSIYFDSFSALALTAMFLTLLNVTLKPFLKILSLPISVLTLGLFSVVINSLVLYAAISLSAGSYVSSFGMAVAASIILSIVNSAIGMLME